MKTSPVFALISMALFFVVSSIRAADQTEPVQADVLKELAKEAAAHRRKAMDCRVMSLNALKNADAVREDSHKALVAAMMSGEGKAIEAARDSLDNAADDLQEVIEDVEKVIELSIKAGMSARAAEDLCKEMAEADNGDSKSGSKKIESLLAASAKQLAKAEKISKDLRKDWLEPFFASTTTTTSTTSTTDPSLPAKK